MQAAREASWNILCKTSSREYVFTQCLRVYPHASDPFFAWILLLVMFSLGVASRIFRKQSGNLLPTHKHPADSIIKTELTSNPLLPYPASPTNLSSTTSKSPHSLASSHTRQYSRSNLRSSLQSQIPFLGYFSCLQHSFS